MLKIKLTHSKNSVQNSSSLILICFKDNLYKNIIFTGFNYKIFDIKDNLNTDPIEIARNYLNNGNISESYWLDEQDLHPGDIVIEFPNPDYNKQFSTQNLASKEKEDRDNTID